MGDKLKNSYDDILYNRGTKIGRIVDEETYPNVMANEAYVVKDNDRLISRLLRECEQQKEEAELRRLERGLLVATIGFAIILIAIMIGAQ